MRPRPLVVTIIAWILILKGAVLGLGRLSLIGNPFLRESMEKARLPVAWQYFETFLGYAVVIAGGILLLRGENLGRWLLIYWAGFSFVLALVNNGMTIDPFVFLLINAVMILLLMRSPAAEYFRPTQPAADGASRELFRPHDAIADLLATNCRRLPPAARADRSGRAALGVGHATGHLHPSTSRITSWRAFPTCARATCDSTRSIRRC